MEEKILPKLLVNKEEAEAKIQARIVEGKQLLEQPIQSEDGLKEAEKKGRRWSKYNEDLLSGLFSHMSALRYRPFPRTIFAVISRGGPIESTFPPGLDEYREYMGNSIDSLEGICERLELFPGLSDVYPHISGASGTKVFIGHGHSPDWRELKDFIHVRLQLPYEEFNRVTPAGLATLDRLTEMLDKAIILIEEGCEKFSNIHGLGRIPFSKGEIKATFEEVRQVLEREGIIK